MREIMYNFLSKRPKSLKSSGRRCKSLRHHRRSHSPNSPRSGSTGGGGGNRKSDDLLASSKPVQDLNYHVRQVKNALTHFKDVILKNKLEMLPGNGTVVLELVANVHTGECVQVINDSIDKTKLLSFFFCSSPVLYVERKQQRTYQRHQPRIHVTG